MQWVPRARFRSTALIGYSSGLVSGVVYPGLALVSPHQSYMGGNVILYCLIYVLSPTWAMSCALLFPSIRAVPALCAMYLLGMLSGCSVYTWFCMEAVLPFGMLVLACTFLYPVYVLLGVITCAATQSYRSVIPDDPLRCQKCGYTLFGLSGARCPECGAQPGGR